LLKTPSATLTAVVYALRAAEGVGQVGRDVYDDSTGGIAW